MSTEGIALRQVMVGGQPYWAAADVAAFLRMSGDDWHTGDHADDVTQQVGRLLHTLADQFSVEAIQLQEWWGSWRSGRSAEPPPKSCLSGQPRVARGVVFGRSGPNVYVKSADVARFLRAEAIWVRHQHTGLFDRESAARMAADYLHDTAEYLDLEAMIEARPAKASTQ